MNEPPQVVRGHDFQVGPRYAVIEFVGEGAYGIVVKATDTHKQDPEGNGANIGTLLINTVWCI